MLMCKRRSVHRFEEVGGGWVISIAVDPDDPMGFATKAPGGLGPNCAGASGL